LFALQESTDSAVTDLEKRIASLEVGKSYDATKEAVQKVEQEFLVKLREIRAALQLEGSTAANSKELDALKKENEQLKTRNAKLEYRIQHVVANMEKMYKFRES
jgi:predicted  nucleic acid-binding Zn-ribbon protein